MIVTKLLEALYRRGYDLEGEFKRMVKICNDVTDDPESETTIDRQEIALAGGTVKDAMGEAIKIAFGVETFCFFSNERPCNNYVKFAIDELQSYIASRSESESKGRISAEMAHVMHYYAIVPVPACKVLMDKHKKQQDAKPVNLKFLRDSPLMFHRGLNMLMPTAYGSATDVQQDEVMNDAAEEESAIDMAVEEVATFPEPAVPPPPMDPIIEDQDEAMEEAEGAGAPES